MPAALTIALTSSGADVTLSAARCFPTRSQVGVASLTLTMEVRGSAIDDLPDALFVDPTDYGLEITDGETAWFTGPLTAWSEESRNRVRIVTLTAEEA